MMTTTWKRVLALVMALLICVTVFAACKGEEGDDTSSTPLISTVSIPSEIEIDITTGEATMAYGSTYADLKADLVEKGEYLEDQGEVLQLFQADKVTEITDEATVLESGMVIVKKNADGEVLFELTLVIAAQVTSVTVDSEGNTVIQYQDGKVEVVNSQNEVISTSSTTPVPPANSTTTSIPGASTTTSMTPSTTTSGSSSTVTPSQTPSINISNLSEVIIPSDLPSEIPTDDKIQLTMSGNANDQALAMAILAYVKEHPNVSIRVVAAPNASYSTKYTALDGLKMQLASGQAPDIINMDQQYTSTAGYENYLLELSQFGSDDVKDLFFASCWEACQAPNGKQYGLPFDANVLNLFYNKDILDAAGAKVPSTYDELVQALNLIKSSSDTVIPYGMTGGAFLWCTYLWRCGGDFFNSDYTAAAFAGAEGVESLQMMVDLAHRYHATVADKYENNIALLASGGAAMCITNSVWRDTFFGPNIGTNYGVTMLPKLKDNVAPYSMLGLYSLALPNKISYLTDETEIARAMQVAQVAYDFIEFYTSTLTYQNLYCQDVDLMPSLVAGKDDPYFQNDFYKPIYEQLEVSKARPGVRNWATIWDYISNAVDAALAGTKSPQAALEAAAIQTNRQIQ